MKALQHDDNILKLRFSGFSGVIASLFMGGLFLCIGTSLLFSIAKTVTLMCERPAAKSVRCQIQESLFGLSLKNEPLEALKGARLHSYTDDEGDKMYKVILQAGGGERSLENSARSNGQLQQHTVEQINAFFQDTTQSTLKVKRSNYFTKAIFLFLIFIGIAIVIGGVLGFLTTWTFDRTQDLLYKRLAGVTIAQYPLSDIKGVHIETFTDSDGDETYRVTLMTPVGTPVIPITQRYTSGSSNIQKTTALIRDFLNLQPDSKA